MKSIYAVIENACHFNCAARRFDNYIHVVTCMWRKKYSIRIAQAVIKLTWSRFSCVHNDLCAHSPVCAFVCVYIATFAHVHIHLCSCCLCSHCLCSHPLVHVLLVIMYYDICRCSSTLPKNKRKVTSKVQTL